MFGNRLDTGVPMTEILPITDELISVVKLLNIPSEGRNSPMEEVNTPGRQAPKPLKSYHSTRHRMLERNFD
ncbi:hypothetical protein J6590_029912 [Homalodisca vitripennis]|nr:hypothetical protein J6590_029912 [Homalodisca vitripennis]